MEPLRRAFYDEARSRPSTWPAWRLATPIVARVKQDARAAGNAPSACISPIPSTCCATTSRSTRSTRWSGDATVIERLMEVLQNPYDEQPEHDELAKRRPEWARNKPGCSALS